MKTADRLHQMSLAINDAELAIGNIVDKVKLFDDIDANDDVIIKLPLKVLRQIANCYPTLNAIVNDPSFTCRNN